MQYAIMNVTISANGTRAKNTKVGDVITLRAQDLACPYSKITCPEYVPAGRYRIVSRHLSKGYQIAESI